MKGLIIPASPVNESYGDTFYASIHGSAESSAAVIVPLLCEYLNPTSVIDIGCGTGTWLSAFRDAGVTDLMGFDGPWVDAQHFEVGGDNFRPIDLSRPFSSSRQFDLVISLEVAEHLPAAAASDFVHSLVTCGEVIVFSAACPGQGGTNHVNEQWPNYWTSLFRKAGFVSIDWLRPQIWNTPTVAWWYAQNILLFKRSAGRPLTNIGTTGYEELGVVHPRHLEMVRRQLLDASDRADLRRRPLGQLVRAVVENVTRRVTRKKVSAASQTLRAVE